MRITIDITDSRNSQKKRCIKVRTKYYENSDDSVRCLNYGRAILDAIESGFSEGLDGELVTHEGNVT